MRAAVVAAILLIAQPVCAGEIVLAKDHQARARIVCDSKHPTVKQAASDLSLYLGKVTGADFTKSSGPVTITILDSVGGVSVHDRRAADPEPVHRFLERERLLRRLRPRGSAGEWLMVQAGWP